MVFTSNLFPGGPILVGKERFKNSKAIQAIIVNNKISNVCPGGGNGDGGYSDSDDICSALAEVYQLPSKDLVLPSSTGIIGWRLPVPSIKQAMPKLLETQQSTSILPAALGIMTTDRYPKVRRYDSKSSNKWSIVGIAKGAGMIEPNMATMLTYILTDLHIPKERLQSMLQKASSLTFNCISVDGDQSTSDTVVILSSESVKPSSEEEIQEFEKGLYRVCKELSEDIVRNGEGTQHVIKVKVKGIENTFLGRKIGKSIINSSLVKCAIAGCDPNVGRIIAAIGSCVGNTISDLKQLGIKSTTDFNLLNMKTMSIALGGIEIFKNGAFALDPTREEQLSDYMLDCRLYPNELPEHDRTYPTHQKSVDISVNFFEEGTVSHHEIEVIGSDLTKEYVDINADYRS